MTGGVTVTDKSANHNHGTATSTAFARSRGTRVGSGRERFLIFCTRVIFLREQMDIREEDQILFRETLMEE